MIDPYVAVLPSIHPPWTERAIADSRLDPLIIVDNTRHNRGVAASWNLGARMVLDDLDMQWLVIVSAACRFGKPGGLDFIDALYANRGAAAVEAAHGIGWHLIAFHRTTLEQAGLFDENFWPGYYEDMDYARRVQLACGLGEPPWWPKVTVDVSIQGFAHGIDLAGVKPDPEKLLGYYRAKWGGPPGEEILDRPFGMYSHDWWPTPFQP